MMIHLEFEPIRFAERGVPQRESWILLDRRAQRGYRLIDVAGLVVTLHVAQSLQVRLIRIRRAASASYDRTFRDLNLHHFCQMSDCVVFQRGKITGVIFNLDRSDLAEPL